MGQLRFSHTIALLLCFTVVHVGLFYVHGIRSLIDADGYISSADFLVANGSFEGDYHFFYAVPVGLMAFFRWMFPGELIPFLVFQCMVSFAAMLCLYTAATRLFASQWAGFVAALFFLLWIDNIQWNTTTMTESISCSVICFVMYLLTIFKGRRRDWIRLLALLPVLFFTRPTSIVIIIGVVIFLLRYYDAVVSGKIFLKTAIGILLLMIAVTGAYVMFSTWDFTEQYRKGNIVTYADGIQHSDLFHESMRVEAKEVTFEDADVHPLIKVMSFVFYNPVYFLKTAALKIGYLISATRPYYSWKHNVYSIVWLLLIYGLFYFGYKTCAHDPVRYAIVTIIMVNCLLIGISSVDWDNRFYIPMEPGIALLAGGGGAYLFRRVRDRTRRNEVERKDLLYRNE